MSKIIDAKGRNKSVGESGYTRVMGNEQLGQLISRVQSTVISNGTELEKMIVSCSNAINDIDVFINDVMQNKIESGIFLCTKKTIKGTKKYKNYIKGIEPDMLIFIVSNQRICKVIELKDGETFDTKKVKGEKENLIKFVEKFGSKIPFETDYFICSFNQLDKEKIRLGMKSEFDLSHILTGKELCDILGIDYDGIVQKRKNDAKENFEYFIDELLKIPEVVKMIKTKI